MARSTVHYADNETNNILKRLHNKLRPAGTPVQRVEYIIELLLLRIFEVKLKQDDEFKSLRDLFTGEDKNNLFSYLLTLPNEQILPTLNQFFFPLYSNILSKARKVFTGNLPQKVQDQLVLIEEVFGNSNFTNNVNSGNLHEVISLVSEIDEERIIKTDLLGDAIESALSETGGTKDIGLYRTPPHILQFMVALVEPTFDDYIFDPACGTGGFLFNSYEYVMQGILKDNQWPGNKGHKELNEWFKKHFDEKAVEMPSHDKTIQFYRSGISGIEYLGMIRKMAAINFYIRGLNPANIIQGDSLAKFNVAEDSSTKSILLANPPFGAERDQDAYPDVWNEYPKESETTILFVKLMLEYLKTGGICAVIVSEGFHTWDQFSAKALRRMIIDENKLIGIISLPQGLFVSKNGQGPKTSILLFKKGTIEKKDDDWIWYYKITNDGYSVGTNRKEIQGCQLVDCLELFHKYVKHGNKPPESKQQFCIPTEWLRTLDPRIKEKIKTDSRKELEAKGDIERLKKKDELERKILKVNPKIKKNEYNSFEGLVKLISLEQQDSVKKDLEQFERMLKNRMENEIAKRIDKAHNYSFNLSNYKSNLNLNSHYLSMDRINSEKDLDEIYFTLKENSGNVEVLKLMLNRLNLGNELEVDIARELLSKLDNNVLNDNEELIELKSQLLSKRKYAMIKLRDYIILNGNKIKPSISENTVFKVLGVSNEKGIFINENLKPEETNQSYFLVEKNQFCYNPYRINVGSIGLNEFDYPNQIISGAYVVFGLKEEELNPKYLDALFRTKMFNEYVNEKASGGVRMNFKFEDLENWEIPLPSLEEQNEIVEKTEKQKAIIDGTKKVIKEWELNLNIIVNLENYPTTVLGHLITESMYGTSTKAEYSEVGIKVIRIGNIGFCNFKLDDVKRVELSKEDLSKYLLSEGDFLIVRSNGNPDLVGKCCVWNWEEEFVFASYLIRFKFKTDLLNPKYVMYFLMSPLGRKLLNPIAGGGTYNISATEFMKVVIPLPPMEIQHEIILELDNQINILDGLRKIKQQSEKVIEQTLNEVWRMEEESIKQEKLKVVQVYTNLEV